jgi:hypothetical protein
MGSALMMGFLRLVGIGIEQVIPAERKSPACESSADISSFRGKSAAPKTRPPAEYDAHAALPCPDIEIGLRHPVGGLLPRPGMDECDLVHNW